jgi:hypothetical protein
MGALLPGFNSAPLIFGRTAPGPTIVLAILALVVIVQIMAVAIALLSQGQTRSRTNDVFAQLAERLNGRYIPESIWTTGAPAIHFSHHGAPASIDIARGRSDSESFTQLRAPWPDDRMRMQVYPEPCLGWAGKLLGIEDLEIGSPEFDRVYLIRGNRPEAIRQVLSANVQECIERLRRFGEHADIFVAIGGGQLLIKKRGFLRSAERLDEFATVALQLFDGALATSQPGIEWMSGRSGGEIEPHCPVCGEPLKADVVRCVRCRTPHHRECWNYSQACAIYGCGEKKCHTTAP